MYVYRNFIFIFSVAMTWGGTVQCAQRLLDARRHANVALVAAVMRLLWHLVL
jgi:hypothetical protein